jgi:hypothetical protein
MVRNIAHLRFGNEHLIEPLLSKERLAAVKIELLEEFGCEGRGGYFDEFGMIRDVIQNRESLYTDWADPRLAPGRFGTYYRVIREFKGR